LASFDFSKFTNLTRPWLDNTWAINLRTESFSEFGVGTNSSQNVSLHPSTWTPKRLCFGKNFNLKICIDISRGSRNGSFCEECQEKVDCSEPRELLPNCSPLNCTYGVNWEVFDAKADILLPGAEGIFRYKFTLPDGQQVYKTDDGATAKIGKEQVNALGSDHLGNLTMGETNIRMSGKVEIGGRTFLIDSKADDDIWVESIDCEVSAWTDWSSCSKTCRWGNTPGQIQRQRIVVTPSAHGGASCPTLDETRHCNDLPCPVNCEVSSWTEWGSCSKSCGFGKSQRARTVTRNAKHSGNACPVLQETKTCNRFQCPVNCEVSTWSPWSSCSKSCGFGEIERKRRVTRSRSPRGSACPVLHQREPCNEFHCQVVVNIITRNAVSNGIMEGVQVDLRIGSTSLPRLNTNSNGQGQTSPRMSLLPGQMVLTASKRGFSTAVVKQQIHEQPPSQSVTLSLTPVLEPHTDMRLVMNWGRNPNDLDLHVLQINRNNGATCETYYGNKNGCSGLWLDVDNTRGGHNGAETITWGGSSNNVYLMYVYDYSNTGTRLVQSSARIALYLNNRRLPITMDVATRDTNTHSRWWIIGCIGGYRGFVQLNRLSEAKPSKDLCQ